VCSTHIIHQVDTQKLVRSDKFKIGKDQYIDRSIVSEDNRDIIILKIPVMVKSDLCWMKEADKGDCDFDHEGYF
jgi:DNA-directed RNA polymerase-4/5 subunit 2